MWLHPIYVDDVTEAIVRCGTRATAIGECFNVAGPEPVSFTDLATAIARAGGARPPRGYLPIPAARALALVGDLLPARLRAHAPLTRSKLDFLTHSRVYDVGKARRVLGLAPKTDLVTGMGRTLEWYRREGYLPAPGEQ